MVWLEHGENMSSGPVRRVSRQDIQLVQNLIERCLQLYMNQKEVVETLLDQAKIEPGFTELVWQKLEEENGEFFKAYYLRLMVKQQILEFNKLLEQQVQLMGQMHPTGLGSISTSNGSHITPMPHNSACYAPEHTGPDLKQEALHHPISPSLPNVFGNGGSSLHTGIHATVEIPSHASRVNAQPAMLSSQGSNVGLLHGINGGMVKSEPGFDGSTPYMFGADGNVLEARPPIGDASVTSYSSVESSSQPLNESLLDADISSFGFLGQIPRNFSLSDLTADFNHSSAFPFSPPSLSPQISASPTPKTSKMAAFSNQNQPFLLDPVFPPIKVSNFIDEHDIFPPCCSPQFHLDSILPEFAPNEENEAPSSVLTRKQSTDSSNVVDKIETGKQVTQNVNLMDKKRRSRNGSSLNSNPSDDVVKGKGKKQRKTNDCEKKAKIDEKEEKNGSEGYIHVRARRGQATDSHSLAERVRREKISERMKTLQQLVPGCDKLSGKAVMLDEIINYVQSLQHQVEFLSMRIASMSPFLYGFGMDFDAFMISPEQATLPPLQQCSLTQTTAFADTTTAFISPSNYHLLDVSPSLLLQSQGNGTVTWDMEMSSFH